MLDTNITIMLLKYEHQLSIKINLSVIYAG